MAQEVRGYVETVLNSLGANVPKAVVMCQVEKAKECMLNKLSSSVRYGSVYLDVMEDQKLLTENVMHLIGDAGIKRMRNDLSDARINYYQAVENGALLVP
ncbi:dynamin-2A-like protein isoform X2 [Tanacetum coccineum]